MQSRMLSSPPKEHHQPVDAQGDAAVRRGAVLQGVQQEPEPLPGLFASMPSRPNTCC